MTPSTYPVAHLARTDRLFSPGQIALATFLGSPFAGSLFLADNFRLLGQSAKMKYCIAGGLVLTALLCVMGWILGEMVTVLFVALVCALVAKSVARRLHGMIVVQHEMHGGEIGSWKMVVWLSLGIVAVLWAIQLAIVLALLVVKANT